MTLVLSTMPCKRSAVISVPTASASSTLTAPQPNLWSVRLASVTSAVLYLSPKILLTSSATVLYSEASTNVPADTAIYFAPTTISITPSPLSVLSAKALPTIYL